MNFAMLNRFEIVMPFENTRLHWYPDSTICILFILQHRWECEGRNIKFTIRIEESFSLAFPITLMYNGMRRKS